MKIRSFKHALNNKEPMYIRFGLCHMCGKELYLLLSLVPTQIGLSIQSFILKQTGGVKSCQPKNMPTYGHKRIHGAKI